MSARRTILNRLYGVLAVLMLLPVGVAAQLVWLHVAEGAELRAEGTRQAESVEELQAQRGLILDRAGRVLAMNTARYEVAADPTVAGFAERHDELVAMLGRQTGEGEAHFRRKIAERASRQYVLLVRRLDEASKEELERAEIPGLLVKGRFARRYTYGTTASHLLGHVDTDTRGRAGLELQLDEWLTGTPGRRAIQRDARGRVKALVGGAVVEPEQGETVVLTLDLVRQSILEEELARGVARAGARWGTAVALDPRTGAVLAMANVPTYDSNRPADAPTAARRNRAITDKVEPGSTFKLVTAVAALESGARRLGDPIETGAGWKVFAGRTMKDTRAHGTISFSDAVKVSSNIGMATTAAEMGSGPLFRTARALGFGQPTGVDLPGEVPGTLRRPETWDGNTLTSMAIGYAVETTPLQMATAYATLANGGLLVQPHLVAERRDVRGAVTWRASQDSVRRAFSEDTARRLRPAFERVVAEQGGTGRAAAVPGLRVAGKTGTARSAAGGSYERGVYRASFAGMFPADDPEVVLYILLDRPTNGTSGGAVAAPIFGAVARRWVGTFPTVAQKVAPAETPGPRTEATLPRVDGLPARLASSRLRAEGLAARLPGRASRADGAWEPVALRDARPGQRVRTDRTVRLDTAEPAGVVPDVRGLSTRQAAAWLRSLGLRPRLRGSGVVREQSVAPGTPLGEPRPIALTAR